MQNNYIIDKFVFTKMALYVLGYWVGIHFYGMIPQFSTVYFVISQIGINIFSRRGLCQDIISTYKLSIYVTRNDILCPNEVKRDVGKTRCKSDVIYATALCCAISVIC